MRYCLGTHLQLVTSASFTYTDDKATGTVCGKDPHKRLLQDMYLQGVDRLADILQEGMDAGVLRPMEARRLAFFLQEMMSTVLGRVCKPSMLQP